MIRIDEIHENTFFAWLKQNRRGFRSFHMHPIGSSQPENIYGQGTQEIWEHNYITFFDAEPIHLDKFRPTFDKIRYDLAQDLHAMRGSDAIGYFVTSEHDSENVDELCSIYGWQALHYFFWGWAALDWYRGYDLTFLIQPPEQRQIKKTFLAPNRIVGGARGHRLELLYHIFQRGLTDNYISCPRICPVEGTDILELAAQLSDVNYPQAQQTFAAQNLPLNMPGETGHPMHSCWLSLFREAETSLVYLVSETVATGRRHQLTEKIFKPICLQMPFVLHSTQGALQYLRSYGFQTFGTIWDESYDDIMDDQARIRAIADLLTRLDQQTLAEKQALYLQALPIIQHNYQHFYSGGFRHRLWSELTDMLQVLDTYRPAVLDEQEQL
jgi:hypothetical protein